MAKGTPFYVEGKGEEMSHDEESWKDLLNNYEKSKSTEEPMEYLPCGVCYPNIYSSKQKLKTLIMPYCEFDEDNAEKVIQEVVRVIDKTRPELIINQKLNSTVVDRTLDYLMEVINGNKG